MDLVDDNVVELGWREFLQMALKHLNGSEKEIRVQSFLIAPIEHGIASRGFEDGLEGFPGSLQNRVFVGQEKQPFGIDAFGVESGEEGFARSGCRDHEGPLLAHASLPP